MSVVTLRRGRRFTHRRFLNVETGGPLRMVVTAVRQGVCYYKEVNAAGEPVGLTWKSPVADMPDRVQQWED